MGVSSGGKRAETQDCESPCRDAQANRKSFASPVAIWKERGMSAIAALRTRPAHLQSFFAIARLLMAATFAGALHAAAEGTHAWKRIAYPMLPIPGMENEKIMVLAGSGGGDEAPHLRFDILWRAEWNAKLPATIADAGRIAVRLHLSDGKVILPEGRQPPSWVGAGTRGITYSLIYTFPWGRNRLEEAWVELNIPGQTYWIELPYGFTRKPSDPLTPDPEHGWPAFPPTMKKLGQKDRLVPWLSVEYDLGEIQNHWRLSLNLANPFDAQAEAILYREPAMRVGESMYSWKLDTPRTAMEIAMPGGRVLAARGTGIRLHEDGLRRSDDFSFNRDPSPEKGRDWGKVLIKVDDKTYECVVPSSLFKYVHGVTDSENTKRLPRPQRER